MTPTSGAALTEGSWGANAPASGSGRGSVRAALGRDLARVQFFAAVRADQQRVGYVAAGVVAQHDGRAELALRWRSPQRISVTIAG